MIDAWTYGYGVGVNIAEFRPLKITKGKFYRCVKRLKICFNSPCSMKFTQFFRRRGIPHTDRAYFIRRRRHRRKAKRILKRLSRDRHPDLVGVGRHNRQGRLVPVERGLVRPTIDGGRMRNRLVISDGENVAPGQVLYDLHDLLAFEVGLHFGAGQGGGLAVVCAGAGGDRDLPPAAAIRRAAGACRNLAGAGALRRQWPGRYPVGALSSRS